LILVKANADRSEHRQAAGASETPIYYLGAWHRLSGIVIFTTGPAGGAPVNSQKLFIAVAVMLAVMLVAIDNSRADDQVIPLASTRPHWASVPREQPVAPFSLAALSGPHCPKIIMGDDRALICGYLARLYDLYCCK
jgi:hypothetical protein